MTKLVQPGEAVRFEPPGQDGTPEAQRIAYWLRAPGVVEEAAWRRACTAAGVKAYTQVDLIRAVGDGVRAILAGDENAAERAAVLTEIRDHLETLQALAAEAGEIGEHDDEGRAEWMARYLEAVNNPRMGELEQIVIRHYPRYREMLADLDIAPILQGIEAAKLALTSWQGLDGQPQRGLKGLSEASLRKIPREHFAPLGAFFASLCGPTRAERKNSASPSGGPVEETVSQAASTQPPTAP